MMQHKKFSPQQFGWVCALVAASTPLTTSFSVLANAQVQDEAALAKNAKIRIHSSNSVMGLNKSLKQQFEGKYSGSSVNLNTMSAQKAIDDVANNTAEVAAIGRPLTPAEKAKGLMEVLVGRDKIAVVVSPNNSFNKDLTIPKFAKMFRGEIGNWSELGGRKEAISFVDRVNSDTRQALAGYPQFQAGTFDSGKNAVKLQDTSIKALTETLKSSGVSFVPANQAKAQAGLRTLSMHGVLPTDARYPFSQPLYYVYNTKVAGGMRSEVKALLGFVRSNEGQAAVKAAGIVPAVKGEAIAAENPAVKPAATKAVAAKAGSEKVAGTGTTVRPNGSPSGIEGKTGEKIAISNNAIAAEQDGNLFGLPFPGWLRWLLPLGLLGMGLLLLLMPRKSDRSDLRFEEGEGEGFGNPLSGVGTASGNAARNTTEIIGNTTNAGAVAGGIGAIGGLAAGAARRRGDTEDWNDTDGAPYIKDETDFNSFDQSRTAMGNAATNTTQAVGDLTGAGGAAAAGLGVAAAGTGTAAWGFLKGEGQTESSTDLRAADLKPQPSVPTINLTSNDSTDFSVVGQEWDFGNTAETTDDLNASPSTLQDSLSNTANTLSARTNETATGIGGATSNFFGRLKDGASTLKDGVTQAGTNAGAAALGGTAASARTRLVGDRAGIVLVPQTAREAVVRWQLTEAQKIDARNQGGIDLALRLYDVTGINPDRDALENFYQYDCSELTQELRIEVPVPARDYVVEVGYLDRAGEWIGVARSLAVHIASV